jgi:hypothetical protein
LESLLSFFTIFCARWLSCFSLAFVAANCWALDSYNAESGVLTISKVAVGEVLYSNVNITVDKILAASTQAVNDSYDTYNPVNNQLSIPSVQVGSAKYYNVLITVGQIISVGNSCKGLLVCYKVNPQSAIPFFKTSYENMKGYGLSEMDFPIETAWKTYNENSPAFGTADFFKSGNIDFFIAKGNYDLNKSASETIANLSNYSEFAIWRTSKAGTWTKIWAAKGCLQPRKAVVVDFNQDGYPDIFVACHGYDADPFPGEKSKMVMSDGKGGYTVSDLVTSGGDGRADLALRFHGASAADLNGDGYPDLVVNTAPVSTLINQKDGTFKFDNSRVTLPSVFNYFSIELIDVNGDGFVDLLAGGHEWSTAGNGPAPTVIAYGDVNGNFGANGNSRIIPPVAGRGIVLDFTWVENSAKKGLYLTRTGDETGVGYYQSSTLQYVDLKTFSSSVMFDQTFTSNTWTAWWLPVVRNGVMGVSPYSNSIRFTIPNSHFFTN